MFVTHPNERAVRAQETSPAETALARLSLRHALKCIVPASTEHAPTAPASNAKISRYSVDMFPPKSAQQTKFKLNCCSSLSCEPRAELIEHLTAVGLAIDVLVQGPPGEGEDEHVHDQVHQQKRAHQPPTSSTHHASAPVCGGLSDEEGNTCAL